MSDAQDIVERLRQERRPTAWTRGLDTDYPTAWEPNPLCHEAADAIAQLRYELDQTRHSLQEAGAATAAERERFVEMLEYAMSLDGFGCACEPARKCGTCQARDTVKKALGPLLRTLKA